MEGFLLAIYLVIRAVVDFKALLYSLQTHFRSFLLLSDNISKVAMLILPIVASTRKERVWKKGRPWRMNSNGGPLSQKLSTLQTKLVNKS